MEKKSIVQNHEVWFREKGNGIPILLLPGWGGPANDYFQLQDKLAGIGYQVVLPDLPGLSGKTSPRYIALEEWGNWVEQFARATIGKQFVLISHSGSARMALQYLAENSSLCLGSILWSPALANQWQRWFWKVAEKPLRFLIPFIFPNMKWVKNRETWATARTILSSLSLKETQPKVPCLVLLGKKDPIRFFFTGWKKVDAKVKKCEWDHSPHIRAIEELAQEIDHFIGRGSK